MRMLSKTTFNGHVTSNSFNDSEEEFRMKQKIQYKFLKLSKFRSSNKFGAIFSVRNHYQSHMYNVLAKKKLYRLRQQGM